MHTGTVAIRGPKMGKKSPKKEPKATAPNNIIREATGATDDAVGNELLKQALRAAWVPDGLSEEKKGKHMEAAIKLLGSIRPANEIEGMLISQMLGIHCAAMECLRCARLPDQTTVGRFQELKSAEKLTSIFLDQMDALNKSRGNAQQTVTVRHVHIEPGAQAVVGNVQAGLPPAAAATQAVPALTHKIGPVLELNSRKRAPAEHRRN
jgi:hypothetical protein